jgi:hypothetical protein
MNYNQPLNADTLLQHFRCVIVNGAFSAGFQAVMHTRIQVVYKAGNT